MGCPRIKYNCMSLGLLLIKNAFAHIMDLPWILIPEYRISRGGEGTLLCFLVSGTHDYLIALQPWAHWLTSVSPVVKQRD